jgi:hypothetical protein
VCNAGECGVMMIGDVRNRNKIKTIDIDIKNGKTTLSYLNENCILCTTELKLPNSYSTVIRKQKGNIIRFLIASIGDKE